jgi:hypothetical protein
VHLSRRLHSATRILHKLHRRRAIFARRFFASLLLPPSALPHRANFCSKPAAGKSSRDEAALRSASVSRAVQLLLGHTKFQSPSGISGN